MKTTIPHNDDARSRGNYQGMNWIRQEKRGIYRILCTASGNCYIGSSSNIQKRWHLHRSELRRGIHHSFVLQRAYNLHGPEAFLFEILEAVEDVADLSKREQLWIDALKPKYNLTRDAVPAPTRGRKMGPLSENRKMKIRAAVTGFKHTEAAKEKMRGRSRTIAQTKAIIENFRKGWGHKQTFETRRLISELQRGRKQSAESITKRSAALTGKPWSDARRAAHIAGKKTGAPKGQSWTPARRAAQAAKNQHASGMESIGSETNAD